MQNHILLPYVFKVIYMPGEAHANSVKDNLLRFNCIKCSRPYRIYSIVNQKMREKRERERAYTHTHIQIQSLEAICRM